MWPKRSPSFAGRALGRPVRLCVLAGLLLGGSACAEPDSPSRATTRRARYTVDAPLTRLVIVGGAGRVQVVQGEPGSVRVTEIKHFGTDEPATEHVSAEGTLTLRHTVSGSAQVSYEVSVPPGLAVRVGTTSGQVTLIGLSGDLDARTAHGGIRGERLTARTVVARADRDAVDMSFAAPPDRVDAEGDNARVRLPAGTAYATDASSEHGSARVDVARDPAAPHRVRVHATSGAADILPTR
ncbi:hypothetical protein [Embleya scabrispora]|uniref:hypothetical protein n=1 Tax=Embleya scabrispora TaxID=159449 RepID=UPI000362A793|nr:hypothetical protein [Embleya scabrispora]MYS87692.1 hypothetical protein [Streptomyces sp. SID5474]